MNEVLDAAALLVSGAGVLSLVAVPVHGWTPAFRLALEFWTGAGLLHLASARSWPALAIAAAIIGVRQLIQLGGRAAAR